MSSTQERIRIAVLDDYQHVALSPAGWSVLDARATVTVINDDLADSDAIVERLQPFDIVCVMRGAHADDAYHHRALAQAPHDRLTGSRSRARERRMSASPRIKYEAPRPVGRPNTMQRITDLPLARGDPRLDIGAYAPT
jgi:hypothetical protein